MLKVQTLVATMNREDYSFLNSMNLEGDVFVINQTDKYSIDEYKTNDFSAIVLSTKKRGLSNSRNEAILNSSADVFLTADDDIVYRSGYRNMVSEKFEQHPEADIIVFNIQRNDGKIKRTERKLQEHWKKSPHNKYYSSVSIAYRKESFDRANLKFHPLFGSGAKYSSGEESLLLNHARKAGLRIFETNEFLCDVDDSTSSWFHGFDYKYFYDKGAWIKCAYPTACNILKYYYLTKKRQSKLSYRKILNSLTDGIRGYERGNEKGRI